MIFEDGKSKKKLEKISCGKLEGYIMIQSTGSKRITDKYVKSYKSHKKSLYEISLNYFNDPPYLLKILWLVKEKQ